MKAALVLAALLLGCSPTPQGPGKGNPSGTPAGVLPGTGTPSPSNPTDPWTAFDADFEAELQASFEATFLKQGVPGAALALARPGTHQRWVSTIGLANLDGAVPWTPATPYPIGSVSKTFTSAMVMQLVEEGTLTLDDPIETWVNTPWGGMGITLRHLLQHTSGIVSYNYVGSFDGSAQYTPQELVDWAALHGPDLLFQPGSQWEYSNTNFILLGQTIEVATGRSFETELQERLLTPLELHDTYMATTNPPDLVRGYSGQPLEDVTEDGQPTVGWAAGGIISTPADTAAWGAALFRGEVLTPASLDQMTTPLAFDGVEYGLGLFGTNDKEFGPHWGHTGGTGGHVTYLYYLERNDAVVVAMVNSFESDLDGMAAAAWGPVLGL